jgi:hypothetical protein
MKKVKKTVKEIEIMFDTYLDASEKKITLYGCIFKPSEIFKKIRPKDYKEKLRNYYKQINEQYYCKSFE